MGMEQLDLLEEEGVDLRVVAVGHCDTSTDVRYHLKLMQRGAFVGFDQLAHILWEPPRMDARIATFVGLAASGHQNQLLLSGDLAGITPGFPTNKDGTPLFGVKSGKSYLTMFEKIIPKFIAAGISQEVIDTILVENPRRLLEGPSG